MQNEQKYFNSFEALNALVQERKEGSILVGYQHCTGYSGMALAIMIVFNTGKKKYLLDLQWMSLGLDLYGDTLQETYVYKFETLHDLTDHLSGTYGIAITDIPLKYQFDVSKFPDPIYHSHREAEFKEAWQRFQKDFKKGMFLDRSVQIAL